MRKSQIALLLGLGGILIVIVIAVVSVRSVVADYIRPDAESRENARAASRNRGAAATRFEELTGFDAIVIRDSWEVDIRQGDTWRVDLSFPEDLEDDLRVRVEDGRLVLESGQGRESGYRWRWWGSPSTRFEAEIVVPELVEIDAPGNADIDLRGFDGEALAVTASSAINLSGHDSRFDRLSLTLSGFGNVEFGDVTVVDADVNLSGFSNIVLDMDGGVLGGSLTGFGNVVYSGSVSEERINVSGFGRVGRD